MEVLVSDLTIFSELDAAPRLAADAPSDLWLRQVPAPTVDGLVDFRDSAFRAESILSSTSAIGGGNLSIVLHFAL